MGGDARRARPRLGQRPARRLPQTRDPERYIQASFLAGAGLNAIIPARVGDAAKIFLAKQSVPGSSYPAMASSFAVLTPFDTRWG